MVKELWVLDRKLDLYSDDDFRYVAQVNDIAEVKDRQASYTPSFKVPKTSNNISILEGLGLVSDTSSVPYNKPNCQLKIDGFDFIVKGWLNITETTEDYFKIFIYSGIINFFKSIENKKIGSDLDLQEINHTKTLDVVADSVNNSAYRYLIADYGGKANTDSGNVAIDYLMPSVNCLYLWDKIHSTYGFTYDCSVTPDMSSLWISYPKAKNISEQIVECAKLKSNFCRAYNPIAGLPYTVRDKESQYMIWEDMTVTQGNVIDYGSFNPTQPPTQFYGHYIIPETGYYKIEITGSVKIPAGFISRVFPQYLCLVRNGQDKKPIEVLNPANVIKTEQGEQQTSDGSFDCAYSGVIPLSAGEAITLGISADFTKEENEANVEMTISKIENEEISFSNELENFDVTAFFKEMLNLYGLTPYTDEFSNHIKYKTIAERTKANVVNWSSKYIERTSESYVYNDYAQKNTFKYKYADKEDNYNDAAIWINNKNLKEEKVVYGSVFYSAEKDLSTIKIGAKNYQSSIFKMWDVDLKDDGTVNYKPISNRYYLIRSRKISLLDRGDQTDQIVTYENTLTGETVNRFVFNIGIASSMQDFINQYYTEFNSIVKDSRVHTIKLDVNPIDLLTLDISNIFYFEQEQQYYFLNRLNYSKNPEGEFVRINKGINYE